jgi:hypothetical protein
VMSATEMTTLIHVLVSSISAPQCLPVAVCCSHPLNLYGVLVTPNLSKADLFRGVAIS